MMPPDTAERMKRALDRLAANPRAVQTLARMVDFTVLLAETVDRRTLTLSRAASLLVCEYTAADPMPEGVSRDLRVCASGADRVCRTCRVRLELLEEFGL